MPKRSRRTSGKNGNKRVREHPRGNTAAAGWQTIRRENPQLEQFYRNILPDFEATLECLRTSLPACLRLNRSAPMWRVTGAEIQRLSALPAESVTPTMEEESLECDLSSRATGSLSEQNSTTTGRDLTWLPSKLSWQWDNLNRAGIKKDKKFASLKQYIVMEEARGSLIRQEAASMIPPLFLDIEPDHLILDMCAAPGSKTSQILDYIGHNSLSVICPKGGVIANEIDKPRASVLIHQLSRLGSAAFAVTCFDAATFPEICRFDRVLADVPCSGDGTLRKQPDIWKSWSATGGLSLHMKQIAILIRGLELLHVGGKLVYSTCSMHPVENEAVVGFVLGKFGNAVELLPPTELLGLQRRPGLTTWKVPDTKTDPAAREMTMYTSYDDVPLDRRSVIRPSMFPSKSLSQNLEYCIRIMPQDNNTSAFFVAVFKKRGELTAVTTTQKPAKTVKDLPTVPMDSPITIQTDKSRYKDPLRLHCHTFNPIDPARKDIQELATFLGFSDNIVPYDSTNPIPCDKVDLRRIVSLQQRNQIKITVATTAEPSPAIFELPTEPAEFVFECHRALGPLSHTFPLTSLFCRAHVDKRLSCVTEKVADFARASRESIQFVGLGVRALEHFDRKQCERFEGCQWRLTQKRVVFMNFRAARALLTGPRSVSGRDLLTAEARGEVLNLGSCRADTLGTAFSNFVPGTLAVIIVPPPVIPIEGFFPDSRPKQSKESTAASVEEESTAASVEEETNAASVEEETNAASVEEETNAASVEEETNAASGEEETNAASGEEETNAASGEEETNAPNVATEELFNNGTMKDYVPICCLLKKSGTLLPYIKKQDLAGVVSSLFSIV